ncbi:MAG: hypothetical protein Tsb0020_22920 [Haliangiales bacterium]
MTDKNGKKTFSFATGRAGRLLTGLLLALSVTLGGCRDPEILQRIFATGGGPTTTSDEACEVDYSTACGCKKCGNGVQLQGPIAMNLS